MSDKVVATVATIPWENILTPSIAPIFALVGALSGALLANYFAEKRFKRQIEHELNKEKIKMVRDKGEELLLTLSKWGKQLYFVQMGRLATLSGNKSEEELKELHKEYTDPYTHVEAHVLLGIYFPQFSEKLDEVFKLIDSTNHIFDSFMNSTANKKVGIRTLGSQATKAESELDALIESIRKHIVDNYT